MPKIFKIGRMENLVNLDNLTEILVQTDCGRCSTPPLVIPITVENSVIHNTSFLKLSCFQCFCLEFSLRFGIPGRKLEGTSQGHCEGGATAEDR